MIEFLEEAWDYLMEDGKTFSFTVGFWAVVMVSLWILPKKMGLGGGAYSQMKMSLFGISVSQMLFMNIIVSVVSLPIIYLIIKAMAGD